MLVSKEQKEMARLLINELIKELDNMPNIDYKVDIVAYDKDSNDYVVGAEECNNWERSWC